MKLFPKILLSILPITILPAVLASFLVMQRGNRVINETLWNVARLELMFLQNQCEREAQLLYNLKLEGVEFYENNSRQAVIQYAQGREIKGAFLFITDSRGTPVYLPEPLDRGIYVLKSNFEPWDWVIGIGVHRSYLEQFRTESVLSTVLLCLGVLVPVSVIGFYISRHLLRPVRRLEAGARLISDGHFDTRVDVSGNDEFGELARVFNLMTTNIQALTSDLESKVHERTADLEQTLIDLREAQSLLIDRERFANLGGVVAGIAHEINTPLGIGVTGSTHLKDIIVDFQSAVETGTVPQDRLTQFLDDAGQVTDLIYSNLKRAHGLISEFKQLSVDQVNEERRQFNLRDYLSSVIHSLNPRLRTTLVTVRLEIDSDLEINSIPGVYYQVFSNLVMNSLTHGYSQGDSGTIVISAHPEGPELILKYTDDGRGIDESVINRIYEPFVSTRSQQGGTGLGMNIVYNLINQKLGGRIDLGDTGPPGVEFIISIPHWKSEN